MTILVNLEPLETTSYFPYLGCKIAFKNRNQVALYINLRKAQQRWGVVEKAMKKTG